VGPTLPLSEGRLAVAALSGRRLPRRSPQPWQPAPLVRIVDSNGSLVSDAGTITERGGAYKSWLAARAVLGVYDDTIFALGLSDGVLSKYIPVGDGAKYRHSDDIGLPTYFRAPSVQERVINVPWLSIGAENVLFVEASHVETAAFGGERLYAIRNYRMRKESFRHEGYKTRSRWVAEEQGLEVYSLEGVRRGSYLLPVTSVAWMRADERGRIFLKSQRRLHIATDPTFPEDRRCSGMPEKVRVELSDQPYLSNR